MRQKLHFICFIAYQISIYLISEIKMSHRHWDLNCKIYIGGLKDDANRYDIGQSLCIGGFILFTTQYTGHPVLLSFYRSSFRLKINPNTFSWSIAWLSFFAHFSPVCLAIKSFCINVIAENNYVLPNKPNTLYSMTLLIYFFCIEDAFAKYGPVRDVWVARKPPGFAFVEMEDAR